MEGDTHHFQGPAELARWIFIGAMIFVLGVPPFLCSEKESYQGEVLQESGSEEIMRPMKGTRGQEQFGYDLESFTCTTTEKPFLPFILEASERHGVDPALIRAIILAESGYNPRAISKVGAKGLMQLMPDTAEDLGVEDLFNPEHNINAGVGYFRQLLNSFDGDVKLALAAYNAGSRKVKRYKGIPPFKATRNYIKKVFEYYQMYRRQMQGDTSRV